MRSLGGCHRKVKSIIGVCSNHVFLHIFPATLATLLYLMFSGPCIVIYLCNKDQQDALFYSQFTSIINLYMFRAGLLLIIRRCFSVRICSNCYMSCVYVGSSQHKRMTYSSCCIYRVIPLDDEQ